MFPSKKAIADYLQLDRSTVSKILNNYDREKFSRETIERVESAARELGYAKEQRRLHPRKQIDAPAQIAIRLRDTDELVTRGLARIHDISLSGMLMEIESVEAENVPLRPFYFEINLDGEQLKGLFARCKPVRFKLDGGEPCVTNRLLGMGVQFESVGESHRENLREYLKVS